MGKQPAFQFYPNDWSRDLEEHPLEIEGAWIRICCKLWWAEERGKITRSDEQWGRILRVDDGKAMSILDYIGEQKIGIVEKCGNNITVTSRRMYREYKSSVSNKERQAKFRDKGGGDPDKWTSIRIPILNRDEYMCAYCGRRADTVDHVTPKSQGGTEDESNLVACCKRCNSRKGDRTLEESGMTFWKGFDIEKLKYNTNITPPSSSPSSSSSSSSSPFTPPKSKKRVRREYPACFERLWEVHSKGGKINAFKAMQKLEPDQQELDRWIEKLEEYKLSQQWKEGYAQNLSTWINGGYFDGDVPKYMPTQETDLERYEREHGAK